MPGDRNGFSAEARRAVLSLTGRLVIAGVLCAAIAVLCWGVLPRFGAYVPAYVPGIAFAVILGAALLRGGDDESDDDGDAEDEQPPDVAGRIGDGDDGGEG
jgi:hypothetical protein